VLELPAPRTRSTVTGLGLTSPPGVDPERAEQPVGDAGAQQLVDDGAAGAVGQDNGGIGPHDSGGPALPEGTDIVAAMTSHVTSPRGSGDAYWYRLDTADARSFLGRFLALP
jgi:hypothetical protein